MKKPISKADIRDELLEEMDRFLKKGGSVDEIPQGISGNTPGEPPAFVSQRLFIEPKTPRTLVPEVVAAIESRRREKYRTKSKAKSRLPRPRRKIIYDDFGEPLRKVWTED